MYRSRLAFALAMAALAAILLPSSLPAQITFQRTYGGANFDEGYSVQQTNDGGYIIAGGTASLGMGGVYLVRTDACGETLWTRVYGGDSSGRGYSAQQTADGGYVVAGYAHTPGAGRQNVYLIKANADGDTLWTRTYGGANNDYGFCVSQTADSGYMVTGATESFGTGGDVYLIKTDADGGALWTRTIGGGNYESGYSVHQTSDGGYVIAGYTMSFGAGCVDIYLVRTNASGDTLWTKTFGGYANDPGFSAQPTADGGFIVAGYTESFGAGWADVYLIKTNADGDTLWTRTFGGAAADAGYWVQETSDSGYIIAGLTTSYGAGQWDVYLIKVDVHGDKSWTRTFGGAAADWGNSVQQTADGGYIITGCTESFGAGLGDVYLIKTDSLGNVAVAEPKGSPTRASGLTITCRPNPATGATTVRLSPFALRYSPLTLRVYDAGGREVLSQPVRTSSFILHASSLPAGAYFVRLAAAGHYASTRLVLQR
jgi:hypothetical protein